jgi:hypothetical protein
LVTGESRFLVSPHRNDWLKGKADLWYHHIEIIGYRGKQIYGITTSKLLVTEESRFLVSPHRNYWLQGKADFWYHHIGIIGYREKQIYYNIW